MVRLRKRIQPEEISAASMSDIAFLLLVFFMVASVFYVREGLITSLPQKDSAPQVVLRQNVYSLHVSGEQVRLSNIETGEIQYSTLAEFRRGFSDIEIVNLSEKYAILSADDTNVQNMVTVMETVRSRGFENISFQKFVR